jgi:hypothetical protein
VPLENGWSLCVAEHEKKTGDKQTVIVALCGASVRPQGPPVGRSMSCPPSHLRPLYVGLCLIVGFVLLELCVCSYSVAAGSVVVCLVRELQPREP